MPMILLLVNQLLVNRVAKIEIQIKLFLENVEKCHNFLKLPFFGLKIRLLFTDLFRIQFRIRIRIRNVYFGSGSDPDPAKSFGSLRIRIRNTAAADPLHFETDLYSVHWQYIAVTFKMPKIFVT
jgi:hypothetical protein